MNVFFDTEFTGLEKDADLISIGLITEDNRYFYAEFTDFDESKCSEWVKNNVLSNLLIKDADDLGSGNLDSLVSDLEKGTAIRGDKRMIADVLEEWFKSIEDPTLISDVCHYDMVLLIDMFESAFDLPFTPVCYDICQDIADHYYISMREAFDLDREEIIKDLHDKVQGEKHNSLYDAICIKKIYEGL